jgi:hypothetical protein
MLHKSFEDLGIPPKYGFKHLLFCPSANVLVVQTQSGTDDWRPERLYYRATAAERYLPVAQDSDLVSHEDPVVAISRPLLAYRTSLHNFFADAEGLQRHGANWESVRVFDLQARADIHVIDSRKIKFPQKTTYGSISNLLGFAESGDILHVVAALSDDEQLTTNYFLSELNMQTGVVRPLATLPAFM